MRKRIKKNEEKNKYSPGCTGIRERRKKYSFQNFFLEKFIPNSEKHKTTLAVNVSHSFSLVSFFSISIMSVYVKENKH